ncbi:hypothetical protein QUA30_04875 [Microcoleus sp. Pol14C2]|uniref:hypothetical protein n=1 Tax=unclassified Microcoleus TaxID=2642155 RepID=UPI002FCEC755
MMTDIRKAIRKLITVFASKNESNFQQLETQLTEANFSIRVQSSLVVGCIEPGGNFPSF